MYGSNTLIKSVLKYSIRGSTVVLQVSVSLAERKEHAASGFGGLLLLTFSSTPLIPRMNSQSVPLRYINSLDCETVDTAQDETKLFRSVAREGGGKLCDNLQRRNNTENNTESNTENNTETTRKQYGKHFLLFVLKTCMFRSCIPK